MDILILAPTSDTARDMETIIGDSTSRYTVAATWADAVSALESDPPDLVVVDRSALTRLEPTILLSMTEVGRWPPMILVDTSTNTAKDGVLLAKHLIQRSSQAHQIGELRIDTRKKRVGLGDRWVTLPPIQYRLLLTLAKRAGEVVSYQRLLRAVWGHDGNDREARELLKVHIRQIRRRLRLDPEKNHYIRSVRGFGYMLISPEEE